MDSLPTSSFSFVDGLGQALPGPREWTPELVRVDLDPAFLARASLFRQSEKLPLFVQELGHSVCVLANWPRTGTGRYRVRLELDDQLVEESVYEVAPTKISAAAYQALIDDLQNGRLPASIAISLERLGGLSGLELRTLNETTPTGELVRLRHAIEGWEGKTGLAVALTAIARDPHRQLVKTEQWVRAERARQLEPVGLAQSLREPDNLDRETRLPRRVPDVRVEHTVDVYENRLARLFCDQVALRLRRLNAFFATNNQLAGLAQTEVLLKTLERARQQASFLDEVSPLTHPPERLTMVLLRRDPYRAVLERYLEFRREAYVDLVEPGLSLPLENLPHLYEMWGTLEVIDVLLEQARALKYDFVDHRLARQIGRGVYVKVLPDGETAVRLRRSADGREVRLVPQRTFGRTKSGFRSISFPQRPDIVIEVAAVDRPPVLLLFDPKYKLESDEQTQTAETEEDVQVPAGQPKKIDIDKMHAYRDAIRTQSDERVVEYAAILYPGPEVLYPLGIEALTADPLRPELLRQRLRTVIAGALG
jgi:predicted component of viral defense system (DUF524 family)